MVGAAPLGDAVDGRLGSIESELRSLASQVPFRAAESLRRLADELGLVRRDLRRDPVTIWEPSQEPSQEPESVVVEPEEADVAPAPETGVRGRVLDKACVSCGGPIIRPLHAKGRPPTRCDDCRKPSKTLGTVGGNKKRYARTHPEPGKRICAKCGLAKDEATGFKVKNHKTGTVESYCQDCRSTYMASRYARVGSKVVTVELLEGDVAIGARCPDCGQPFQAGQRVQGEHLHHENCPG